MDLNVVGWIFFLLVIKGRAVQSVHCDKSRAAAGGEGPLGQTPVFPWLGVIRVFLREDTSMSYKVALTGIVYVKEGYAIANADDIVKIPKRVFHEDSHAMFVPRERAPWYCRLRDYMTHPEYEARTLSSVALVELDPGDDKTFPMPPICWPSYAFNASNQLYAMGFSDENNYLEKFVYQLQYVDEEFCQEFYSRAGLEGGQLAPSYYRCGFAFNRTENCIWENGIVLASNVTGNWKLLGLGLHGPGCAAPARFIDLLVYLPWIEAATTFDEDSSYRKSAFNTGFRYRRRMPGEVEDVPAHELLRRRKFYDDIKQDFAHYYVLPKVDVDELFYIERLNGAEIVIHKYNGTGQYGNCRDDNNRHIYKERFEVKSPGPGNEVFGYKPRRGTVTYRLSLYDLLYMNFSCVIIRVHSAIGYDAYLHYSTALEGGDLFQEGPKEIIRVYPYHLRRKHYHNEAYSKIDPLKERNVDGNNFNLYLKYNYVSLGRMDIDVLGVERSPILEEVMRSLQNLTTTKKPPSRRGYNDLLFAKPPEAQLVVRTKDIVRLVDVPRRNVAAGSTGGLLGVCALVTFLYSNLVKM